MNYRTASMQIIAAFILVTGMMIPTPVSGGQATNTILLSVGSDMTFEGMLVVKEADGVFIVRSEDGKNRRFTLNKNTIVTRNEKPATYKDLRSRDQVSVHYNSDFAVTEIKASGP